MLKLSRKQLMISKFTRTNVNDYIHIPEDIICIIVLFSKVEDHIIAIDEYSTQKCIIFNYVS